MTDANPNSITSPIRTLEEMLATGSPCTFTELEAAVHADAVFTGQEESWTLAALIQEIHFNLITGAMRQLGRDSYCFVPEHPRVDFASLARRREKREKKAKEEVENAAVRERDEGLQVEIEESRGKVSEERVGELRAEAQMTEEQVAREQVAWNQRTQ